MSELKLFNWDKAKTANLINSVPLNTPVFVYGKTKKKDKSGPLRDNAYSLEYDEPNEFFVKRMLGLDEEE